MNHYSQFDEDTWLAERLTDVTEGFYVDVGAHHPTVDSVTYAFYEAGWHGVTIEPDHEHFAAHRTQRDRDLLVTSAIGDGPSITYYHVPGTGLSTTDPDHAAFLVQNGYQPAAIVVPAERLDAILDEYVGMEQPIHFMSIDVEGSELEVLSTLGEYRPWYLVIEAVKPISRELVRDQWEHLLKDYDLVHHDGVNDFWALK